ncbi:MAG: HDOD domain-containing protein [Pseudomonadales bacterium]
MTEETITYLPDEEDAVLYGLDAWTEYLAEKPLPARASSLTRLKQAIVDDRSTVQQLAAIVKKDPVLCLYTVREAQKKHNVNESAVTSIFHSVTSLGYDGMEQIARKVEPMTLNPTNVQQKRFLHAVANSHHAAAQVRSWMLQRNLPLVDESFLAALFYSVGFWSLWLHAPLHMQQIQTRIHENGEPPMDVENEVLGCSMQMISLNLSKKWQLSELTQQAQDHKTSPSLETLKKLHLRALDDPRLNAREIRELNHITLEKYFPIKLANWVALSASRSWYSEQTARSIDLVSDYMGLSREATTALIHSICGSSSREYSAPGIMSPASQLLFIQSDIQVHYKMGAKEFALTKQSFPEPVIPPIKPLDLSSELHQYVNSGVYELIEEQLLTDPPKFDKPTQVLMALMQGLIKGLGVKRIALLSVSPKKGLCKTIQSYGFDNDHPMRELEAPLQKGNIFYHLCKKRTFAIWDKLTKKEFDPMIGHALASVFSNKEFMMVSLFKAGKPVAIVYLDMQKEGATKQVLSNFVRERTRHLCYTASFALDKC